MSANCFNYSPLGLLNGALPLTHWETFNLQITWVIIAKRKFLASGVARGQSRPLPSPGPDSDKKLLLYQ